MFSSKTKIPLSSSQEASQQKEEDEKEEGGTTPEDSSEDLNASSDSEGEDEEERTVEKLPGNIKSLISLAIQFKEHVAVGPHKRFVVLTSHKEAFVGKLKSGTLMECKRVLILMITKTRQKGGRLASCLARYHERGCCPAW